MGSLSLTRAEEGGDSRRREGLEESRNQQMCGLESLRGKNGRPSMQSSLESGG